MSDGSAEFLNTVSIQVAHHIYPLRNHPKHMYKPAWLLRAWLTGELHGMSNELYRKAMEERKSKEEHRKKLVVGTYEAVQTGNLYETMTDFTFKCNVICLSLLQCPYYLFGCLDVSYIVGLIQQGLGPSEVLKYHRKHGRGLAYWAFFLSFLCLNLQSTPEEGAFHSSPMLIICFILATMTSSIKSQALKLNSYPLPPKTNKQKTQTRKKKVFALCYGYINIFCCHNLLSTGFTRNEEASFAFQSFGCTKLYLL